MGLVVLVGLVGEWVWWLKVGLAGDGFGFVCA